MNPNRLPRPARPRGFGVLESLPQRDLAGSRRARSRGRPRKGRPRRGTPVAAPRRGRRGNAGGSRWTTEPSPPTRLGSPWLTITPISVTPSVAPIWRENWVSAVADPICRIGTEFWIDEDEHLHHQPEPDPGDDHVPRRLAVRGRRVHPREQEQADREDDRPDDRVQPVVARARDPLAGEDAHADRAEHQGREHDARRGGRRPDHALHEQRDEGDRPEHRHPDERHARRRRPRRSRLPQQVKGQDRLPHRRSTSANSEQRGRPRRRRRRPPAASSTRTARPAQTSAEQERGRARRRAATEPR